LSDVAVHRISAARILRPESVAVIGASADVAKFGGRVMHYLVKHGFQGRLVPVNPGRDSIFDMPCIKHISEAGAPVDVALLALPPAKLVAAVVDCAEAGVGACIIMTTGFAEAGPEGEAAQDELMAIVQASGMRLIGPNCMGLISPHHNMALTSSLVLEDNPLRPGRIGLISQSGALMVSMYNRADDAGIGFSACVSMGNQADLEICDFLEFLIDDPETAVICLYVEGLKDARRFLDLADRARAAGKPLLLTKTGRTEAGVRAAMSHTASLAGAYEVFATACQAHGVVLLDDPDGMIELGDCLARWGAPLGDGIGVLSSSGGGAGNGVDRLSEAGLRIAALSDESRAALGEILLPPQADNPIDIGGRTIDDPFECARRSVGIMAADPDVAVLWVVLTTTPFYDKTTEVLATAAMASGKPFLFVVTPGSAASGPRQVLRRLNVPFFDRMDDGIRILKGAMDYRALSGAEVGTPSRPPALPSALPPLPHHHGQMTEPEVKQLLGAYGIPVTREKIAPDADQAVAAANHIGYPVVLKAVCRDLVHKSDIGAVRLGLRDAAEVKAAFGDIVEAVSRALPDGSIEGCVVQEMSAPRQELLLGVKRDPQFGPVVVVGAGGVLVELLADVEMALAPFDIATARAMLERLAMWPLLKGFRGRKALDTEAAAAALSALSWLAHDYADHIAELDINPLGIGLKGDGVVALDGRATIDP
jgi:acyl-CoA synthetase (NDP forming)